MIRSFRRVTFSLWTGSVAIARPVSVVFVLALIAHFAVAWGLASWGGGSGRARNFVPTDPSWGVEVPADWSDLEEVWHARRYEHPGWRMISVNQATSNTRPLFLATIQIRVGWPFQSLQSGVYYEGTTKGRQLAPGLDRGLPVPPFVPQQVRGIPRRLPINVLWGPFALNQALYMTFTWLGWQALRVLRRYRRKRQRQCQRCGYAIDALPVCPECGLHVDLTASPTREPRELIERR